MLAALCLLVDLLCLVLAWADRAAGACLLPLAIWILMSGLDDLFVFAAYARALVTGRLPAAPPSAGAGERQRRIAIFVPLWQEEAVIRGMLEHNLAAVKYENYDFFVGAYPNDPGTVRAVRSIAARSPRVHLAMCPHDGPTSKADCMNWIYQSVLLHERQFDVEFDLVMTHDAEDLIHPEELRLVNHYAATYDMIQVPVLPLPTSIGQWIHGIYCDDFAECHTKDLPARWCLGGFIPSSGVGTALSRKAVEALAASDSNLIFRPDCLTEDYETGYRLRRLGLRQLFMPLYRAGTDPQPIATREFFPKSLHSAQRQRTRWITGIALQGWARNGWGSGVTDHYWFWRDRKGLIGNPASLLANVIFFYGVITWAACTAMGWVWGLGNHLSVAASQLLPATAAVGIATMAIRATCSASVYGWGFALWSPVRSIIGNLVNSMASVGAVNRFLRSIWLGEPLVWLKTEHAYPSMAALQAYKQSVESILLANGAIAAEALDQARRTVGAHALADHLVAVNLVSEDALLAAQMTRHQLPGGEIPPKGVPPRLLHLLPAELATMARVVPIDLSDGMLKLACPDLPIDTALDRLRSQLKLPFEFHLVTSRNFLALLHESKQ